MGQSDFLKRVSELDEGDRAALRRAAGSLPSSSGSKALAAFYKAYPPSNAVLDEDCSFQAACLQCLWKPEELSRAVPIANAGAGLPEQDKTAFERRLKALLDLNRDSDGFMAVKLYRLVRYCKTKNFVIDCNDLLWDLLHWDDENRSVRRKWARIYYAAKTDRKKDSENNKEEQKNAG